MIRIIVLTLSLSFFASPLFAQGEKLPTAKEVLARFVKETGGADAYKAIKSRVVKGKMQIKSVGVDGTLTSTTGAGGKYHVIADIKGVGKEEMGCDGTTHWSKSQFTGIRILEGAERAQQLVENDLQSVLHQSKYYKDMKVVGKEKVNDEDHYRLEKVNKETGAKHVDFYSVKTGLATKSVIPATTPLGKVEIEVTISDYRKVGDLLVSHKSIQKLPANMVQELTLEKVEINPKVEAAEFALPEEVAKLKAKAAEKKAAKEKAAKEKAEEAQLEKVPG